MKLEHQIVDEILRDGSLHEIFRIILYRREVGQISLIVNEEVTL